MPLCVLGAEAGVLSPEVAEETEDHGTVYETRTKKMRAQIAAMKEIWTKDKPEQERRPCSTPRGNTLRGA